MITSAVKCISFSLYGTNEKYLKGALENVKLAQAIFPDYYCYFFVDSTVPTYYQTALSAFKYVKLVDMSSSIIPPMMWRFTAIDLPEVGLMLSRDTDSRLSEREKSIIDVWEKEDSDFVMIKDHPGSHTYPFLMGGLWGLKKIANLDISQLIQNWLQESSTIDHRAWGADQAFLMDKIYPITTGNISYYDDYNINRVDYCKKINVARKNWHFIGEIFDDQNQRDYHWKALRGYHLRQKGILGWCYAKFLNLFQPEWHN
jgi:hypothetical protein